MGKLILVLTWCVISVTFSGLALVRSYNSTIEEVENIQILILLAFGAALVAGGIELGIRFFERRKQQG